MKSFISLVVGILVFSLILFVLDPWIVRSVMNVLPETAQEWFGLIRIGIWIVLLYLTFKISVFLATAAGALVYGLLNSFKS